MQNQEKSTRMARKNTPFFVFFFFFLSFFFFFFFFLILSGEKGRGNGWDGGIYLRALFIQRVRFVNGALNTSFTKFVVKIIL